MRQEPAGSNGLAYLRCRDLQPDQAPIIASEHKMHGYGLTTYQLARTTKAAQLIGLDLRPPALRADSVDACATRATTTTGGAASRLESPRHDMWIMHIIVNVYEWIV